MNFILLFLISLEVVAGTREHDNLCNYVKQDIKKKAIQIAQIKEKVNYSIENSIKINQSDQSELYRLADMLKRETNYYEKYCIGE